MSNKFSVYKWKQHLIENETIKFTKKLKDITWDDVAGLNVPALEARIQMDNRPVFDDTWRQNTLNNWKQKLVKYFPNAMEFDISVDKSNPTWFEQVKINNPEYLAAEEKRNKDISKF